LKPFITHSSAHVITGYNTDVEHDGVVYHVQTEDKGLENPIVLSLVYSGGAILASKRSSYQDLITAGFDENTLAERLNRQHRLICAAINAGRIDDLKGMKARQPEAPATPVSAQTAPDEEAQRAAPLPAPVVEETKTLGERPPAAKSDVSPYTVHDSRRRSPLGEAPDVEDGLRISLLNEEQDFRGGRSVQLRLIVTRVSKQAEKPISGAAVSVKILGTTFRPVIHSAKTNREGIVNVSTRIPAFTSGRAAILIKATADDLSTETRRVIYPR
jgi:hypothetical protein